MPELRPSLVSAPDRSRKPVIRWVCLRLRIAGVPDLQGKPQMQCSQAGAASSQSVRKSKWRLQLRNAATAGRHMHAIAHLGPRGAFSPDHVAGYGATRLEGLPKWPCGSDSAREEALGSGKALLKLH